MHYDYLYVLLYLSLKIANVTMQATTTKTLKESSTNRAFDNTTKELEQTTKLSVTISGIPEKIQRDTIIIIVVVPLAILVTVLIVVLVVCLIKRFKRQNARRNRQTQMGRVSEANVYAICGVDVESRETSSEVILQHFLSAVHERNKMNSTLETCVSSDDNSSSLSQNSDNHQELHCSYNKISENKPGFQDNPQGHFSEGDSCRRSSMTTPICSSANLVLH